MQMTYVNLDTEELKRFRETFSADYLKNWYQELLNEYHKWVSFRIKWKKIRNASMEGLEFPFPYRKGQREIVTGIYHAVSARTDFCPGSYRSGKNNVSYLSGSKVHRRRQGRNDFLSDCQDSYQNCSPGCL